MQIIINITEHNKSVIDRYVDGHGYSYKDLTRTTVIESLAQAVHKGIPLPKGHGRLIDADVLVDGMEDDYEFCEAVNATPTIIEADKSEEEGSELRSAIGVGRMTRVEENEMVISEMVKRMELKPTGTYEEMLAFQLGTIATMLTDISKSLAILADKAESEPKDGEK